MSAFCDIGVPEAGQNWPKHVRRGGDSDATAAQISAMQPLQLLEPGLRGCIAASKSEREKRWIGYKDHQRSIDFNFFLSQLFQPIPAILWHILAYF